MFTSQIKHVTAYLQRAFISVSKYVTLIKIHHDLLELWSQNHKCIASFLSFTVYSDRAEWPKIETEVRQWVRILGRRTQPALSL